MRTDTVMALALLALAACGDAPTNPVPTPPVPLPAATMTIVSGAGQRGAVDSLLGDPLAVRVTNARNEPVPGVPVLWTIDSGDATLEPFPGDPRPPVVATNAEGISRILLLPRAEGEIRVVASIVGGPVLPAAFTVMTTLAPVFVIGFGPVFDCSQNDPSRFRDPGPIPVGSTIAFEYGGWLHPACSARVVSILVPAGGKPFDTGILRPGQRYLVKLDVAGEWTFGDRINGGDGRLTVQ